MRDSCTPCPQRNTPKQVCKISFGRVRGSGGHTARRGWARRGEGSTDALAKCKMGTNFIGPRPCGREGDGRADTLSNSAALRRHSRLLRATRKTRLGAHAAARRGVVRTGTPQGSRPDPEALRQRGCLQDSSRRARAEHAFRDFFAPDQGGTPVLPSLRVSGLVKVKRGAGRQQTVDSAGWGLRSICRLGGRFW